MARLSSLRSLLGKAGLRPAASCYVRSPSLQHGNFRSISRDSQSLRGGVRMARLSSLRSLLGKAGLRPAASCYVRSPSLQHGNFRSISRDSQSLRGGVRMARLSSLRSLLGKARAAPGRLLLREESFFAARQFQKYFPRLAKLAGRRANGTPLLASLPARQGRAAPGRLLLR